MIHKSQGEIAGGAFTSSDEVPSKGHLLPDFRLISSAGDYIQLSDFRGRSNLVLLAVDDQPATAKLVSDIAARYSEIKNNEAEVLAIVHGSRNSAAELQRKENLPYLVLADDSGRLHRQLGAVDSNGRDSAAVYVTDRFAEVFGVYRRSGGDPLPSVAEILKWLEFVNVQCPECEPPEWPV